MAKVVQFIETVDRVGRGTHESPVRHVRQLWTLEGVLVAECDFWTQKSWFELHLIDIHEPDKKEEHD